MPELGGDEHDGRAVGSPRRTGARRAGPRLPVSRAHVTVAHAAAASSAYPQGQDPLEGFDRPATAARPPVTMCACWRLSRLRPVNLQRAVGMHRVALIAYGPRIQHGPRTADGTGSWFAVSRRVRSRPG